MAVVTATFQKCGSFTIWILCKIGGREPCSQTPIYDTLATAGKQATAEMLATATVLWNRNYFLRFRFRFRFRLLKSYGSGSDF
jgi:hypothetical protein